MTPYEKHKTLDHETTWHSPDGFCKVEECTDCGARFLHSPIEKYPRSLVYRQEIIKCEVCGRDTLRRRDHKECLSCEIIL